MHPFAPMRHRAPAFHPLAEKTVEFQRARQITNLNSRIVELDSVLCHRLDTGEELHMDFLIPVRLRPRSVTQSILSAQALLR